MNLPQTERCRWLMGKIGLVLAIIFVTAMLDVALTRHLTSFNVLHVLPGDELPIDGPLPEKIALKDLTYECDSPEVKLTLDQTYAGFWLGGNRWRGKLQIGPEVKPGKYSLIVTPQSPEEQYPPVVYSITVYPDLAAWRQSSPSYYYRYAGISHWWVIVAVLPLLFLAVFIIMRLSGRIDALLARSGIAEVYRVRRVDGGSEISFSMGTKHGLTPGTRLTLQDNLGQPLGQVEVLEVFADHSVALADRALTVQAGYLVRLPTY